MIKLTRLNGKKFTLNAELIVTVEETPDTVITLLNGSKFVVRESEEEIAQKVIEYRRQLFYINRQL